MYVLIMYVVDSKIFDIINYFIVYTKLVRVSLSEPHLVRSTVKSVLLLACLLDTLPYMAKTNQHYIRYMQHYVKHVEC